MGLLDDAIREHLELKRKRGADSHEVERQEQEALGPPLRGEFAPAPEDPAAGGLAEPGEPVLPAEVMLPAEPVEMPLPAEAEAEAVAAPQATTEYTPPDVEPPPEEPAPEPPHAAEPPSEESPAGEDVLEETPEFLQETPEHERLWFEQKPPRGFDLDR